MLSQILFLISRIVKANYKRVLNAKFYMIIIGPFGVAFVENVVSCYFRAARMREGGEFRERKNNSVRGCLSSRGREGWPKVMKLIKTNILMILSGTQESLGMMHAFQKEY